MRQRLRVRVEGVVQGVGFRPHVYRLALRLGLAGFVSNDAQGVLCEVEGAVEAVQLFPQELRQHPPPAAVIERLRSEDCPLRGEAEFSIADTCPAGQVSTLLPPDLDCCPECARETLDPADRRYLYPFTNCTNCGPRFTLIEKLPYDRPSTTMAAFLMCPQCRREYDDPRNRRFHAQPNACSGCGPRLSLGLEELERSLAAGEIVAVKGVGGFHLMARIEAAPRLRALKNRQGKPFAVLVADLETARSWAIVGDAEAELLTSRARPIVLLQARAPLPDGIAPGSYTVGLMLPSTPLHHLMLRGFRSLIATSANRSGMPIEFARAPTDADRVVDHDRRIAMPCDDSVMRVFRGQPMPVRRSRGYAPFPVTLPFPVRPALAVGGQMKSTFCLGRERHAFLSQHLGDLENLETLQRFQMAEAHLRRVLTLQPELVCADLHRGYLSTRWAEETGLPVVSVQHHHAHVAACMAEHGLPRDARVLGLAFDGTGLGTDGTLWGGEVLECGYGDFARRAWLRPVPLPGGEAAIREPWRMALAHLWAAGLPWDEDHPVLLRQLERGLNAPLTSSVGRLFDAVAARLGVRARVDYEAQAAIELEARCEPRCQGRYRFGEPFDPAPVWEQLLADQARGEAVGVMAMRFHRAVAEAAVRLASAYGGGLPVALTGGVFQNVTLLELTVQGLEEAGLKVLWHRLVPPNDGGLALGQLAVGAHQA